jgi:hypothetical protein
MEKILYYVVNKQLETIGDIQEANGFKDITVYEIIDNKPKIFIQIEYVHNYENSETSIQEWLDENGFGDETFKFVGL